MTEDNNLNSRVKELEKWKNKQETRIAVDGERQKHMDERFDKIEKDMKDGFADNKSDVGEIKGVFNKVLWIIASALILSIVAWVKAGNLNV